MDASHFDAGTAYVAAAGHPGQRLRVVLLKTSDYGKTWTAITGDLPAKGYVHVIREDPKTRTLLYAGTELGLWASWDGGAQWTSIRQNMPPVAVRDIQVHPRDNDLIVATHGRGLYILDDIAPLQEIAEAMGSDAELFEIRPAIRWAGAPGCSAATNVISSRRTRRRVPDFNLYLKAAPPGPVTVTISDKAGRVVRTIRARAEAGVNRIIWNLRYETPGERPQARPASGRGVGGGPRAVGGPQGVSANPGEYRREDPRRRPRVDGEVHRPTCTGGPGLTGRSRGADAGRAVCTCAADACHRRGRAGGFVVAQLTAVESQMARQQPAPAYRGQVAQALAKVKAFKDDELVRPIPGLGYRQYPRLREDVQSLVGYFNRGFRAPNEGELTRLKDLTDDVAKAEAKVNGIIAGDIAAINEAMKAVPRVVVEPIK